MQQNVHVAYHSDIRLTKNTLIHLIWATCTIRDPGYLWLKPHKLSWDAVLIGLHGTAMEVQHVQWGNTFNTYFIWHISEVTHIPWQFVVLYTNVISRILHMCYD